MSQLTQSDLSKSVLLIIAAFVIAAMIGYARWNRHRPPETGRPFPSSHGGPDGGEIVDANGLATGTFGAGCFWCTEAVFQAVRGVESVKSGYSGGHTTSPTYREVCSGTTGHAEVIQVRYDPKLVTYPELLEIFWRTHDPTTENRQGLDVGSQYRSIILYHNGWQQTQAEHYLTKLTEAAVFHNRIVTEIEPFTVFYKAEAKHQDYYSVNGTQLYCKTIIQPKLKKFRQVFADKLKPSPDHPMAEPTSGDDASQAP